MSTPNIPHDTQESFSPWFNFLGDSEEPPIVDEKVTAVAEKTFENGLRTRRRTITRPYDPSPTSRSRRPSKPSRRYYDCNFGKRPPRWDPREDEIVDKLLDNNVSYSAIPKYLDGRSEQAIRNRITYRRKRDEASSTASSPSTKIERDTTEGVSERCLCCGRPKDDCQDILANLDLLFPGGDQEYVIPLRARKRDRDPESVEEYLLLSPNENLSELTETDSSGSPHLSVLSDGEENLLSMGHDISEMPIGDVQGLIPSVYGTLFSRCDKVDGAHPAKVMRYTEES